MSPTDALRKKIRQAMLADQGRFRRRLRHSRRGGTSTMSDGTLHELQREIDASIARRRQREADRPTPIFDDSLPIHAHADELRTAIEREQVIVVCGETGSGKTTQLPLICLQAGRGAAGLIGHTQPRRIAARSVAARMAEQLGGTLGDAVGYQVRFADETSESTYIKVMTDGILLAEIPRDRLLRRYDTLIIDEAHERSLNIDFLLGYLRTLLDRRPDLRIIVTSATIDPERFSEHFGGAPIMHIEGRTYPVEVRYRPLTADETGGPARDVVTGVLDGLRELDGEPPGDTLVFLPGERDIRDVARALRGRVSQGVEVLPLYSRLSLKQQSRVFEPHDGTRIVLATNVAETSITVPGIRYVIDPGEARISRYSARSRVQRLPIEPVSQASAQQRSGRCGRVRDGICIRLYDEYDFESRDEFTQPEILRANLAGVILRMIALGLGDIETFPFIEPPRQAMIREGFETLRELSAIDESGELTSTGRMLAKLPIDPRLGRILLAGRDHGALREMLIIVAGLSIPDPRERPVGQQDAADRAHAIFRDQTSDVLSLLRLWNWYHDLVREGPWSAVRRACVDHFVSFVRMREWQDVHHQLRAMCRDINATPNKDDAPESAIHRALLAGFLAHIGKKDEGERGRYLGAHGTTFHLFPGSSVARAQPRWIVGTEIIETSKRFAHGVGRVRPKWIEQAGAHLVRRTYAEPNWDKRLRRVMAKETVTLFGIPLIEGRPVHYGPISPDEARTIFITRALVEEELEPMPACLQHNRALIRDIKALEARHRRRNLLVDERVRWAYYDARIPRNMSTAQEFEGWLKRESKRRPDLLHMTREDLLEEAHAVPSKQMYPDHLDIGAARLRLTYRLEPGAPDDGVTIHVPVEMLNQITPAPLHWLVRGMLEELLVACIRTLPKALRTSFVPAPDHVARAMPAIRFGEGDLRQQLSNALTASTGVTVQPADWDLSRLPDHLRMNIRVLDEQEEIVAEGRDLRDVRRAVAAQADDAGATKTLRGPMTAEGLTSWSVDVLPESIERMRAGTRVQGFPALVDCGRTVALRVLDTHDGARSAHRLGVTRLGLIAVEHEMNDVLEHVPGIDRVRLLAATWNDPDAFQDGMRMRIVDVAMRLDDHIVRTPTQFEDAVARAHASMWAAAHEVVAMIESVLEADRDVEAALDRFDKPVWQTIVDDVDQARSWLMPTDVLIATPAAWFPHLPRYLAGLVRRLDKLPGGGHKRDEQQRRTFAPFWDRMVTARREHDAVGLIDPALTTYRWMLEEFRIALFAQELGTAMTISAKRLEKQWQNVRHRPSDGG